MARLFIANDVWIDESELAESFVRASGPGGQNVNKVATAVQLRFDAIGSRSLAPDIRTRLMKLAGKRLTKSGEVVIVANRFRTQERNRADALERLVNLIARAAKPPLPRRKTRPPKASRERRLADKKAQAETKQNRKKPSF